MKGFKKIEALEDSYVLEESLGGDVWKAKNKKTEVACAIKIVKKSELEDPKNMIRELNGLEITSHRNIAKILELCEDTENYYVISEFIQGGNLKQLLVELPQFPEKLTNIIIK